MSCIKDFHWKIVILKVLKLLRLLYDYIQNNMLTDSCCEEVGSKMRNAEGDSSSVIAIPLRIQPRGVRIYQQNTRSERVVNGLKIMNQLNLWCWCSAHVVSMLHSLPFHESGIETPAFESFQPCEPLSHISTWYQIQLFIHLHWTLIQETNPAIHSSTLNFDSKCLAKVLVQNQVPMKLIRLQRLSSIIVVIIWQQGITEEGWYCLHEWHHHR